MKSNVGKYVFRLADSDWNSGEFYRDLQWIPRRMDGSNSGCHDCEFVQHADDLTTIGLRHDDVIHGGDFAVDEVLRDTVSSERRGKIVRKPHRKPDCWREGSQYR